LIAGIVTFALLYFLLNSWLVALAISLYHKLKTFYTW
jgi:hypothetical protein